MAESCEETVVTQPEAVTLVRQEREANAADMCIEQQHLEATEPTGNTTSSINSTAGVNSSFT